MTVTVMSLITRAFVTVPKRFAKRLQKNPRDADDSISKIRKNNGGGGFWMI